MVSSATCRKALRCRALNLRPETLGSTVHAHILRRLSHVQASQGPSKPGTASPTPPARSPAPEASLLSIPQGQTVLLPSAPAEAPGHSAIDLARSPGTVATMPSAVASDASPPTVAMESAQVRACITYACSTFHTWRQQQPVHGVCGV